jgi:hypothetical protein
MSVCVDEIGGRCHTAAALALCTGAGCVCAGGADRGVVRS